MLVLNGKIELRDGFRVLCESPSSKPDEDYVDVTFLGLTQNGATISFVTRDSMNNDAARLLLSK